ncbi:DUF2341 domain-containing protein [Urbifossiella limnaea]|uniref:DUF2341 domain-containing protein n=1 Tax=Urbifossiella limnaea TaxID=2528023 RepID=A0A517XQN8_9BACT|nr:DUF2341 domain-containing protein [Urbifossiella limnaea]QDU19806.1 hypothetical protein ETAA1_17440 [Urbifossiella limnaea]
MKAPLALGPLLLLTLAGPASAAYQGWAHAGSVVVLTTPDGADLPATATVRGFPLLIRLHKDFFDFAQTKTGGEDLRFSAADGTPLAYQIEEWDAAKGVASVWVRVPEIRGNARQEIKLHWGKADARSEASGKAVFNESNGFLSVWHMSGPVADDVGTLASKDTGTTPAAGVIGPARHFPGRKGVFGGDKIADYPTGSSPHTTEAWFRPETPNSFVLAWGNEHGQGKVVMHYRSPPHVRMECYFSGADVAGKSSIPRGEWVHVVHTYEKGNSRVYVNGALDGVTMTPSAPLAIKSPARLWLGGWYDNYTFTGDIDEVRVSKVARSAEWIRLQYENQKPFQTLVGPVVRPGRAFSVTPTQIAVAEGGRATVTAEIGGAEKLYWVLKRGGREQVVAVDRLAYTFDAGRVVGDQTATLQLKAVYPDSVKTKDIPVTITEAIPEPVFTLRAPATWDGRATIEVVAEVANLDAMRAAGAGELTTTWNAGDIAVIKEVAPGKLMLTRAQNSGPLTVTATVSNGGAPTTRTATIAVREPATDPWVRRVPAKEEKPEENQFYARDDGGEGTLHYNGTLDAPADAVFLRLYADDRLVKTETGAPAADKSYALSTRLRAGLVKYRVEFGTKTGNRETVRHAVGNLVCGDAFVITGQSNAVATDFGKDDPAFRSDWIRTFGTMSGNPKAAAAWGKAVHRGRDGETFQIGYWGMELGRRLVEEHKVPVCILNGAVGGTRIDQHQRRAADPEDLTTLYGRLLWRVKQAKLTHGIRAVLWHQGENDQGADGPTGGYGYETYRQYFIDLAAAWKQDFPNVRHYYVFQIWPKSCSMGINGSDNRLREVQRTLPTAFSNLSVMSTLGINPPGGCHFPAAGYAEFARLITPLVERDFYGKKSAVPITPPNLRGARYVAADEVVLEFDQPVRWDAALAGEFTMDGEKGKVASGAVAGNRLTLKLASPSQARHITYLDSKAWSQARLLRGANGLAALTFCEVPIEAPRP